MKKIWIPILAILLGLLVLGGALVFLLVALPRLTDQSQQIETAAPISAAEMIAESWPYYHYAGSEDGVLTLEYDLGVEYEKVRAYGVAAGYDEVAAGSLDTAKLISYNCYMQCGFTPEDVVIVGLSIEGHEIYRASLLHGVTACWDE